MEWAWKPIAEAAVPSMCVVAAARVQRRCIRVPYNSMLVMLEKRKMGLRAFNGESPRDALCINVMMSGNSAVAVGFIDAL